MNIKNTTFLKHRRYLSTTLFKESVELILLDRDGVINIDLPTGVHKIADFQLIPKSAEAIQLINAANIPVVIVTNQALVGRGEITEQQLGDIHNHMRQLLQAEGAHIDKIYYCTDTTIEPHKRRKPAPGMINEALQDFQISHKHAIMIGDALRDIQAGQQANCRRILVRTGKGAQTCAEDLTAVQPVEIYDDLWQAVRAILLHKIF